jgi:hypothetical protein
MMTGTTNTTPPDVDPARFPEPIVDCDDADARRAAPDVEDAETDEAGYGYGV